uniref:Uncharacterized protein n=1 Tax=Mycena chlorophos TaxID=658473 RepID=A0ABQ0LQT6_MYCCL|nr:predicted protein [Mycena chlorophos]
MMLLPLQVASRFRAVLRRVLSRSSSHAQSHPRPRIPSISRGTRTRAGVHFPAAEPQPSSHGSRSRTSNPRRNDWSSWAGLPRHMDHSSQSHYPSPAPQVLAPTMMKDRRPSEMSSHAFPSRTLKGSPNKQKLPLSLATNAALTRPSSSWGVLIGDARLRAFPCSTTRNDIRVVLYTMSSAPASANQHTHHQRRPSIFQKLAHKFTRSHARSVSAPPAAPSSSRPSATPRDAPPDANATLSAAARQAREAALRERGLLPALPLSVQEARADSRLGVVASPEPHTSEARRIKEEWAGRTQGLAAVDELGSHVEDGIEEEDSEDVPSLVHDSSTLDSVSLESHATTTRNSAGAQIQVYEPILEEDTTAPPIQKESTPRRGPALLSGFRRTHKAVASVPTIVGARPAPARQHQRTFSTGVNPTIHNTGSIMAQTNAIEDAETRRMTEVAFM